MQFLISGSNRGFGWAMTRIFMEKLPCNSFHLLCSCNQSALQLLQGLQALETHSKLRVTVVIHVLNFGRDALVEEDVAIESPLIPIFSHTSMDHFLEMLVDRSLLVDGQDITMIHNAATLGPLRRISTMAAFDDSNSKKMDEYWHVNLTCPMYLTSQLLSLFPNSNQTICNISSLAAIQPFESWSWYASAKSARDMFFSTLAIEYKVSLEEDDKPRGARIKVLNYAPGPMDTQMQTRIREEMQESQLRTTFIEMKNEKQLVNPDHSARVLFELLQSDFESGSHIDFYDISSTFK
jgi:sepiapterin reductase